ncbi:MAG: DUF11 domain-containing protein, partial [Chloroflexales bacterium]|nr:DUF11 domain-containing protein [Chloroflexales bacterium]
FNAGVSYPAAYAPDDTGRLFVADSSGVGGPLHAFTTSAGIPTPVASGPFASGLNYALDGLWHPAGYYMVATLDSKVGVYRVGESGAATVLEPTNGSPFTAGGSILALNRTGALLFAANVAGGIFTSLVNPSAGTLRLAASVGTNGPTMTVSGMAYAAAPLPSATHGYVYALRDAAGGNQIYGYRVDPVGGSFTPLDGFPVATGGDGAASLAPERLSFDPVHSRLYALNDQSDTLSAFAVDLASGALSALPGSPYALGSGIWSCVKAHPGGSPVIVGGIKASGRAGSLVSFRATEAALVQAGSPLVVGGTTAESCAFSPDGGYLYVAGPDVGAYRVNSASGTLTALPGSPYFSGAGSPLGLAVDGNNRLLMSERALAASDGTPIAVAANRAFTLSDGQPAPVSGNPFLSGLDAPVAMLLHPAGYFIVADMVNLGSIGSALGVYRVSGSGAATRFDLISSVPAPEQPRPFPFGIAGLAALAIDHTGTMLFTANELTGALQSAQFDAATGTPRGLSTLPQGALGTGSIAIAGLAFAPLLPDLTISMSSTSVFSPGADVAYTLQVTNRSVDATTPITVTDELPLGLSYRAASGAGWSCAPAQEQVTCTHPGPLPGGAALPALSLEAHLAAELGAPPVNRARVILAGELATGNNESSYVPAGAAQTLTFGPLPNRSLHESPFAITATASSGLSVQLSSATPEVCVVEG